jgi:glycosyltransferase involved in cell wall biosynthesis
MRIAVVASPVTPLRPAQLGGAQAFVCDLAVGLTGRGHDVTLHCAEGSEVAGVRLATVPAPRDALAALVMPGGAAPPPAPGVAAALAAMFERISESGVDVVSQHAFDAPAFELPVQAPVLHTLHLPPIVPAVASAAMRVGASRLATVSASCRDLWRGAGVAVGQLLPNGVPDLVSEHALVEHAALIAGRISPEKGIDHAIAAARRARLPVRLAGAKYDPAYEVGLEGVDVLGLLPRHDLSLLMAQSAVTICAVRWDEPFGMVAAEAQMAGCPVAGYRRGALPEVVEESVSGYLAAPDDVEGLALAVNRCLELDRDAVRASAQRRLGLEPAVVRYEVALAAAAR